MYPTGRINVSAGHPATGCILIENEGNIPSLFIFPLWPGSPHLSGMTCSLCLGWLCLCFPHSYIAPGVSGAEDKVLILTFLQFPSLSPLLSVSAFPHLKVGAVYLAVLYKPKLPRFQTGNTPNLKSFKSTFLQFWHNINSFMSMLFLHSSLLLSGLMSQ